MTLTPNRPFASTPGQFVMVRVRDGVEPLLRRPLGIHRVSEDGTKFELLFREVGTGTAILAKVRAGDELDVLAPLGKGFHLGDEVKTPLLVGGGIGVAPLLYLAETLMASGKRPTLILGGRSDRDILCHGDFECLAVPCLFATEDGTLGETGFVTKVLGDELEKMDKSARAGVLVQACGPTPMLTAVANMCASYKVGCEVSLESHMACGVGACRGCIVKSDGDENLCVCKDGPVFDATELYWP
jgi:dihydroorotate dehydrogenase electron transfer subunit